MAAYPRMGVARKKDATWSYVCNSYLVFVLLCLRLCSLTSVDSDHSIGDQFAKVSISIPEIDASLG